MRVLTCPQWECDLRKNGITLRFWVPDSKFEAVEIRLDGTQADALRTALLAPQPGQEQA